MSDEAKLLMEERDTLNEEATSTKDSVLLNEFKKKRNEAKVKVEVDKKAYYEKEFDESKSSNNVWKSAYKILGQDSNKSPTQISVEGDIINSPEKMANCFNEVFFKKVNKIREKTKEHQVKIDPIQRLKSWLLQRPSPLPKFEIKPLTKIHFRKVINKHKICA